MKRLHVGLSTSLAVLVGTVVATAQVSQLVFDNTSGDQSTWFGSANEFGDEINLSGFPGTDYLEVTYFEFAYTTQPGFAPADSKLGVVQFYANDSGVAAGPPGRFQPGTPLLAAPLSFKLQGDGGAFAWTAANFSAVVPRTFTWTVSFQGLDAADDVGLDIYDAPDVGTSANDFWMKQGGTWTLNQIAGGTTPANFYARVIAIPEPTSFQLAMLAGLGILGARLLRKR